MKIKKLQIENRLMLFKYLIEVQYDFTPPLFQRISERSTVQNVNGYVDKVLSKANVFAILDKGKIVAAIAIYTNDIIECKAYIPILSVKDKYRGKGLASILLERVVKCAKECKMKVINIRTWPENKKAIELYTRNGFNIIQQDEFSIHLKNKL
jgi:ribosomal-protein-alanine N-acetyltransferase